MCAMLRKPRVVVLSALVVAAWAAGPVRAQDWNHYWANGSGDFEDTVHWWCVATGTYWAWPPGEGNGARFGYAGWAPGTVSFNHYHRNVYMTVGDGQATFRLRCNTYYLTLPVSTGFGINVGDTAGLDAFLTVEGGGIGPLNVRGTLLAEASCLGYVPGASGVAELVGQAIWESDWLYVGRYGDGSLNVREGSRLETVHASLGTFPGSRGSVTLGQHSDVWTSVWTVQEDLFVGGLDEDARGGPGEIYVDVRGELQVGGTLMLWDNSRLTLTGGLVVTQSLVCVPGATVQHFMGRLHVAGGLYDPGVANLTLDGSGPPELILDGLHQAHEFFEVNVGDHEGGSLWVLGGTVLTNTGSAYIGRGPASSGRVTVAHGGSSWSAGRYLAVGYAGSGELTIQYGGNVTCDEGTVGGDMGSEGTVTVDGAGSSWICGGGLIVGMSGTGALTVSNGGAVVANHASIGCFSNSTGTVTLQGAGSRFTTFGDLVIPREWATGVFRQEDGTARVGGDLNIGAVMGYSNGTYEMFAGTLDVRDGCIQIGGLGVGSFGHYGGLVIADEVSRGAGGTFVSTAGTLRVNTLTGFGPDVSLAGSLQIGHAGGAGSGSYGVDASSSLSVGADLTVGYDAAAQLTQTGGTVVVGSLRIGQQPGSDGTYAISGGALTTPGLQVGVDGAGTFRMSHPSATVTVTEELSFGPHSKLEAVSGTEIHMAGAGLTNRRTDWAHLSTLANLTLIFEGGMADVDTFEVAGWDMGPVPEAFELNLVLGTLQMGGAAAGRIELVDDFDNVPGWPEALYVHDLVLNEGAYIASGGLKLYYLNGGDPKRLFVGDANLDGEVGIADLAALADNYGITEGATWVRGDFNGDLIVGIADLCALADNYGKVTAGAASAVPEPTALAMLAPAGIAALLRRRRRLDARAG